MSEGIESIFNPSAVAVVADSRMVLVRPENGEQAQRRARQWAAPG